jgi:glycosyltransferase involved in cell wall biosynthesis
MRCRGTRRVSRSHGHAREANVKIAVDARELAGRPTGVGRYLSELLDRWSRDPDAARHDWHVYAHQTIRVPDLFAPGLTVLPGSGGAVWEQRTFGRALRLNKPDVLFAPGYTAPVTTPAPIVLTIHDLSFAAHPEWFSWREGVRRRTLTAWSARRARLVLTDSHFSRLELQRHLGLGGDKVRVIPLGFTTPSAVAATAREPVILFVGSIFRRRHVDRLVDVFVHHVANRVAGSRLEIVGENRLYPPGDPAPVLRTCPPGVASRVTLRSYVDDAELADLYRRASVFAFLSDYEGFGLPPLEALAAGVPPVVLDTPIAREVYGNAARYVPSLSTPQPLADALIALLSDAHARHDVLQHAGTVLARYDWSTTAAVTLRAVEEAAGA